MDRAVSIRALRRTICGDKKANRLKSGPSPELTGNFEAGQCAQAVAEEGKWPVQERSQSLGEGFNQRREPGERSLHQPGSPSGELNRADLNLGRQAVWPGAKDRGAGSRVRK